MFTSLHKFYIYGLVQHYSIYFLLSIEKTQSRNNLSTVGYCIRRTTEVHQVILISMVGHWYDLFNQPV